MSDLIAVFIPAQLGAEINFDTIAVTTDVPVVKEYVDTPVYTGEYEITPSAETQMLDTTGKRMAHDVVIAPIPNNYGLITWNGSVLTVS